MENYKIHYLGFGIQNMETEHLLNVVWHLGAKYGAKLYNKGVKEGAIKLIPEDKTVKINVDMMNNINEEMLKAGEILY